MSVHTKGPWRWLPDEGQFIVDANDQIVAEVPCTGGNPEDGARIVACVNACDGLHDPVTEVRGRLAVRADDRRLRKILAATRQENSELIDALSYYADKASWAGVQDDPTSSAAPIDYGERARAVLKLKEKI